MNSLLLPHRITREQLRDALCVSERVASKDRSNLYIVSQFFEDRARYDAFIAMYAVMRLVDDRVDDVTDKALLSPIARDALLCELDAWEKRIGAAYAGTPLPDAIDVALAAAVLTFPVPIELWLDFIDAMRFDVRKPRFDDFEEFLDYGEGATVAPTSIYVYLLTSRRQQDGKYRVCDFDFLSCGRDLGRFAYIAHVLRDVSEDLQVGSTGLVYLSNADLCSHELTESDLRALTNGHASHAVHERWRSLVHDICARAQHMRRNGAAMARSVWDSLPADCAFIFRLIVGTYAELLDRIDADPDCVLRSQSVLSDQDKFDLLRSAADATGFRPDALHA
jgi:phytoene/squalene synthetase